MWIEISLEYSLHIPGTSLKVSIIVVFTYILPECFLCLYTHIWTYRTVFCCCSVIQWCLTLGTHGLQYARLPCPSPSPRVSSNTCPLSQWFHLILCHPLLFLLSIFPSIRFFSNELALCIRWPKYCSFSFSNSISSKHSGLTSFRIDWFDLHVVQGTLKSLLQHHSSKASILWCSAFFKVLMTWITTVVWSHT